MTARAPLRLAGAWLPAVLAWLALLLPAILAPARAAPVELPKLEARVTDLTSTLDAARAQALEARLAAIESARGAQVAILLLPTTGDETIEQFAIRLAEAWKIGHKGRDDGVIVIVAKEDRKMRIEVGYGLEGTLPDAVASRIIRERMVPAFKQGDFAGGLEATVTAIEAALGGKAADVDAAPLHPLNPPAGGNREMEWVGRLFAEYGIWLLFLMGFAGVLQRTFGLLGALSAAAVGGWIVFRVFEHWLGAPAGALFFLVVSYAKPSPVSAQGRVGGGSTWSTGGSSHSSGSFSSGGDGFSGGGGSFGGGGSSGSW